MKAMPKADPRFRSGPDVNLATVERIERIIACADAPLTRYSIHKRLRAEGAGTTAERLNRALSYSTRMGHVEEHGGRFGWLPRGSVDVNVGSRSFAELVHTHGARIRELAQRHNVEEIFVFGSIARGDARQASDLDLLIDPAPGFTVFDQARLLRDLRNLLGGEVDIVTRSALHPLIRDEVLAEARRL